MSDLVTIELAKPEDAKILADISKRAFDTDVEVGALVPGGPQGYDSVAAHRRDMGYDSVDAQRSDALNERTDYWKAIYNDQIVGGTRVHRVSPEHCYIFGVFVDPDLHRRGIGTQFFQKIEGKYPQAKKWSLNTPEWNIRTKRFYEKVGFVQTGILRWVPTFNLRYFVKITDDIYQEKLVSISKLNDGMEGISVKGTVELISEKREVTSKDGKELHVVNATLTDATGSVTLVLWNDQILQIHEGESIVVENGYVNEFRGTLQLNIARNGQIIIKKSVQFGQNSD
ncbi:MAG: GNAT family N-acetyltransferase [Candidatus Thorarchaeota archaeon]|nr:GNAT family N-acetyltransferase [Candidatus Thorarchaeota archaeon]